MPEVIVTRQLALDTADGNITMRTISTPPDGTPLVQIIAQVGQGDPGTLPRVEMAVPIALVEALFHPAP